jgi:hypothetical protein
MSAVIDSNAIQAVFAQPSSDGAFEGDLLSYLKSVGALRSVLLLAFAPKAAGTFFRQAAMEAIGGSLFRLPHAQGGRDATPYLPNLLACYLDKDLGQIVAHLHMQAFTANRNIIDAFGIRPVIMLRNIPDMLASFWDMLEADPVARAEGLNGVVPSDFLAFSDAQKADFMVDIIAPWYASYFASWKTFVDEAPKQVCVLRYRNFCQSPPESLHAAINHAGFVVSRKTCEAALARVWTERESFRFNKGTEGRGRTYFSSRHVAEIARKLAYYPQLKTWMPDIMGSAAQLHDITQESRAAC